MSRILTQSELATWLRCRRKWWLESYRALKRRRYESSAPLNIGTMVHLGLEAYYRPEDRRNPLEVVALRASNLLREYPDSEKDILDHADMAGIMLEGYMQWLEDEGRDADLEVISAEQPVQVAVGEYTLLSKLDARAVRRSDSLLLQLEHKTVQNLKDLPKTAQTNFQFLTYDLVAYLSEQQNGTDARTDGILLNMLRKVKRSKAAKPPFYGRHDVRHNAEELRSHWKHVLEIARDTDRARARLDAGESHHSVAPPTPTFNCSWDCQFAEVCLPGMFDDGSNVEGALEAGYTVHDPLERYNEGGE